MSKIMQKIKFQKELEKIEDKLKRKKLSLRDYYIEIYRLVGKIDKSLISNYFPEHSKAVPSFLVDRFRGYGQGEIMMKGVRAIIPEKTKNGYDKKRILLQLRSDEKAWGIPSGMVEVGDESISSALKREVLEETGLKVKKFKFIAKLTDINNSRFTYSNGDRIRANDDMFEIEEYSGEVRLDKEGESLNLKFFHIDKLPKNFLYFHKIPLKHYKEYLKTGKVIIG